MHVIELIFDHTFHEHSYSFRRKRSCKHALERVEGLLVDVRESEFDFLGYKFRSNKGRILRLPRPKSEAKFRDSIRRRTGRMRSGSTEQIIAEVNEVTRGWFVYFRHSYPTVFKYYDGWIRRRLRSILRSRVKLRGISKKGKDHQRWPNAYFEARGFYSLVTAHASYSQSSLR